jgi:holo-[acyl-carrier protein] synthase
MILSIGIDIVEVYRIRQTLTRTPRFATRVFTETERSICEGKGAAAYQSYAGRFAAKEAFLKALGTGWRGRVTWHEIEIINDPLGAPSFNVSGEAAALLTEKGAGRVHLSISHTSDTAIAQVIFEKES